MTNTLTAEQIAQGWIAYAGQSLDPLTVVEIYTPASGSEFGTAGDFDFTQPTDDDYETDPIGAVNNFITMYRTFSPDLPSPPVSGEAVKLRIGQVWKTRGGWIASVFAKSPFPEYPFTVGHNKGDVLKNYSANHRADGQCLDVESDDDLVELLSSPSDDDARRYIENWCPDHVKDYIASLSPLTNEPVGVTQDAHFLLDRLAEFEAEIPDGEASRQYEGHVRPAIARLSAAIGERG